MAGTKVKTKKFLVDDNDTLRDSLNETLELKALRCLPQLISNPKTVTLVFSGYLP